MEIKEEQKSYDNDFLNQLDKFKLMKDLQELFLMNETFPTVLERMVKVLKECIARDAILSYYTDIVIDMQNLLNINTEEIIFEKCYNIDKYILYRKEFNDIYSKFVSE